MSVGKKLMLDLIDNQALVRIKCTMKTKRERKILRTSIFNLKLNYSMKYLNYVG